MSKFTTTTRPLQILCVNRGDVLFPPASCAGLLNEQAETIARQAAELAWLRDRALKVCDQLDETRRELVETILNKPTPTKQAKT